MMLPDVTLPFVARTVGQAQSWRMRRRRGSSKLQQRRGQLAAALPTQQASIIAFFPRVQDADEPDLDSVPLHYAGQEFEGSCDEEDDAEGGEEKGEGDAEGGEEKGERDVDEVVSVSDHDQVLRESPDNQLGLHDEEDEQDEQDEPGTTEMDEEDNNDEEANEEER